MDGIPTGWHCHSNGGGLVEDTAKVDQTAFVGYNARVYGHARVSGCARVYHDARVYGDARVSGNAWVYANAWVYGNAQVRGDARVSGRVYGIMRSDEYCFVAVPCADGINRVIAGCRYFTEAQAREHWRGGTKLGDETMLILDFFKFTGQL